MKREQVLEARDDEPLTPSSERSRKIAAAMSRRRQHISYSSQNHKNEGKRKADPPSRKSDPPSRKSDPPAEGHMIEVDPPATPTRRSGGYDWPDDINAGVQMAPEESFFPSSPESRVTSIHSQDSRRSNKSQDSRRSDERDSVMLNWPIGEDAPSFREGDLSPTEEIVDGYLKRGLDDASTILQEERSNSIGESTSSLSSSELSKIAKRAIMKSRNEIHNELENDRVQAVKPVNKNDDREDERSKYSSPSRSRVEKLSVAKNKPSQTEVSVGRTTQGSEHPSFSKGGINDEEIPQTVQSLIANALSEGNHLENNDQVRKSTHGHFKNISDDNHGTDAMEKEFSNVDLNKEPQSSGERMKSLAHLRKQNACDSTVSSNKTTRKANERTRKEVADKGKKSQINCEEATSLFPRENLTNDLSAINEGDIGTEFKDDENVNDMQGDGENTHNSISKGGEFKRDSGNEEGSKFDRPSSNVKHTDKSERLDTQRTSQIENRGEKALGSQNALPNHPQKRRSSIKNSTDPVNRTNPEVQDTTQHSRTQQAEEYGDSSTLTKSSAGSSLLTKGSVKGRNSSSSEEGSNINSLMYSSYEDSMRENHTDESTTLLGTFLSSEEEGTKDGRKKNARKHEAIAQIVNEQEQNNSDSENDSSSQSQEGGNTDALQWWKKRYACNQNDDVNRMVKDALTPSASDDGFKVVPISKDRWNIGGKVGSNFRGSESENNHSQKQSSNNLTDFENEFITQPWQQKGDINSGNVRPSDLDNNNKYGLNKNPHAFSDEDSHCSGSLFSGLDDSSHFHGGDPLALTSTTPKQQPFEAPFPPPPPPPRQVPFGQVDTVNSDITSSLLNGEGTGTTNWTDWSKKSNLVIAEEASGDITAETDSEKLQSESLSCSRANASQSGSFANTSHLGSMANTSHLGSMANKSHSDTVDNASLQDDTKSLPSITSSQASQMRKSKSLLNAQSEEFMETIDSPSIITPLSRKDEEDETAEGFGSIFINFLDTVSNFCSPPAPAKSTASRGVESQAVGRKKNDISDAQSVNTANDSGLSAQSTMNEQESQKWDKWHRLDSEARAPADNSTLFISGSESFTDGDFTDGETFYSNDNTLSLFSNGKPTGGISTKNENEVRKKQAKAHEKLVTYTKLALTASSQDSGNLSKTQSGTACTSSPSRSLSDTSQCNNGITPTGSENDRPRTVLGPKSKFLTSPMDGALSLSQRRIFEKFCLSLRNNGMEVLKQNRDAKWQVRYITFSKEQTEIRCVKLSHNEKETGYCPTALLWVKRFNNRNKDYSMSLIDKHGRGGVLLSEIVRVTAKNNDVVIPKKYQLKYRKSVVVLVEYNLNNSVRSMSIRCKSTNEAHFLCTGLRVCMDVLKRERDGLRAIAAK